MVVHSASWAASDQHEHYCQQAAIYRPGYNYKDRFIWVVMTKTVLDVKSIVIYNLMYEYLDCSSLYEAIPGI